VGGGKSSAVADDLSWAASAASEAGAEGDLVVHGGQAKAGIVGRVRSVRHTPRRASQVVISGGAGATAKVRPVVLRRARVAVHGGVGADDGVAGHNCGNTVQLSCSNFRVPAGIDHGEILQVPKKA